MQSLNVYLVNENENKWLYSTAPNITLEFSVKVPDCKG